VQYACSEGLVRYWRIVNEVTLDDRDLRKECSLDLRRDGEEKECGRAGADTPNAECTQPPLRTICCEGAKPAI